MLYGPPPVTDPMVSSMYFVDANASLVTLYGDLSVPINSKIVITFTADMDTAISALVTLTQGANTVALNPLIWEDVRSLSVTPTAVLLNTTEYTLSLTDATSASGKKAIINANATAAFKTA